MNESLTSIAAADITEGTPLARALLDLNNAHAAELSWLAPQQLRHLVAEAFLAIRIGSADALLLALDQEADHASPNFLWMRARFDRFVYVDRIVVAPHARGRGHARRLYDDVFARAAEAGHERVVCEVNSDPPNAASNAFHAALGFEPVGSAVIHGGSKTVRYLARRLGKR